MSDELFDLPPHAAAAVDTICGAIVVCVLVGWLVIYLHRR